MKMNVDIKDVFIWTVSHGYSFWHSQNAPAKWSGYVKVCVNVMNLPLRLVLCSSSHGYGNPLEAKITQSHVLQLTPFALRSLFTAASKYLYIIFPVRKISSNLHVHGPLLWFYSFWAFDFLVGFCPTRPFGQSWAMYNFTKILTNLKKYLFFHILIIYFKCLCKSPFCIMNRTLLVSLLSL